MAMIVTKSNEQLNQEEIAAANAERAASATTSGIIPGLLISDLRKKWDQAVRAKRDVETQFFKNIDQAKNAYESQKLAAIREMGGSEVFVGITDTKCRHGKAWIRDAIGSRPYALEPTPVPDMPREIIADVTKKFISQTLQEVSSRASAQGVVPDMAATIQEVQMALPELRNKIEAEVKNIAWEKARDMEKEVDDKLVDGLWYDAVDECIPDFVLLGTAVILGPFKRNRQVLEPVNGQVQVTTKVIEEFERVSPFSVYPQPDSRGPQDGWVFIKMSYRKTDLQDFLNVGIYDDTEIRQVISESDNGTLREWTLIETERAEREKKDTTGVYTTDIIDCLMYMGPISGKTLKEASVGIDIPDDKVDFDFKSIVWFIGNHIIKAMVNEDPLGRQPIYAAHFDENVDGWWGRGLPELISGDIQVCNACARAVVNNVAMGSGPQVEINIDRLRGGDKGDTRLIPWKRWLTKSNFQQSGPAIQFWQPAMHAQEIMNVFNDFKKGADDRSNIPAYAHGDSNVGGAGNTASGLSMLISQAARGIRGIIKNLDKHLIIPSVTRMHELVAQLPKYISKVGDVRLIAKGSLALIEKEQRTVRMLEFLNATNNDADKQLMGMDGRAYLLTEVCSAYEIDPERALPHVSEFRGQRFVTAQEMQMQQAAAQAGGGVSPGSRGSPAAATRNIGPSGEALQGGETQLLAGRGGPSELPAE